MDANQWADFWRYQIGVNVIPADSINKKTFIKWKEDPRGNWQIEPIPKELHDEWKQNKMFDKGIAVVCGRIFHNPAKKNLYLCAIDADNRKGIEVICKQGLAETANITMVEQHANPNKAHFYFYTTRPMPKKSSDAVNLTLLEKMNKNEVPALEMKGDGTHGIMYCTPSPHQDGSNYQIVGIREPAIYDKIGDKVNEICNEYSLGRTDNNKVSMKVLVKDDTRILEGNNRHEGIMRYAESVLRRVPFLENSIFWDIMVAKNNRMCVPPLSDKEMQKQINDAKIYINKQIEEEEKLKQESRFVFGTTEFWNDVEAYKRSFNPTGTFIKCLQCKVPVSEEALGNKHFGHKVIFC